MPACTLVMRVPPAPPSVIVLFELSSYCTASAPSWFRFDCTSFSCFTFTASVSLVPAATFFSTTADVASPPTSDTEFSRLPLASTSYLTTFFTASPAWFDTFVICCSSAVFTPDNWPPFTASVLPAATLPSATLLSFVGAPPRAALNAPSVGSNCSASCCSPAIAAVLPAILVSALPMRVS
ncbi:Uncharacterised protein [Burkholderia cenocepacia]|nr:Uncharacterised protein [Burkholderia cenocepacia]